MDDVRTSTFCNSLQRLECFGLANRGRLYVVCYLAVCSIFIDVMLEYNIFSVGFLGYVALNGLANRDIFSVGLLRYVVLYSLANRDIFSVGLLGYVVLYGLANRDAFSVLWHEMMLPVTAVPHPSSLPFFRENDGHRFIRNSAADGYSRSFVTHHWLACGYGQRRYMLYVPGILSNSSRYGRRGDEKVWRGKRNSQTPSATSEKQQQKQPHCWRNPHLITVSPSTYDTSTVIIMSRRLCVCLKGTTVDCSHCNLMCLRWRKCRALRSILHRPRDKHQHSPFSRCYWYSLARCLLGCNWFQHVSPLPPSTPLRSYHY